MKRVAAAAVVMLVEIFAFHSPTASLWVWAVTALLLLRRALVLNERTHLVLSACGDLLGGLGSVALALLAWRGYTVLTFPGRWQLYSGIWLGVICALQGAEKFARRVEWSKVAEASAEASLWDLLTSRRIPDLRNPTSSTQGLGA